MKDFLEKRGAGILAVFVIFLLGVPALVEVFLGITMPWIVIVMALSLILTLALLLVAVWYRNLKLDYAVLEQQLKEITEKSALPGKKKRRTLLEDTEHIQKLNIDNILLMQLYDQARGLAVSRLHDAELADLSIIVEPYQSDKVALLFTFYSRWADKQCVYIITETDDMEESTPDRPVDDDVDRKTFAALPWVEFPNWSEIVSQSYEKIEPLSKSTKTTYQLSARAWRNPVWSIRFIDGITNNAHTFSWDGKNSPVLEK